MHSRSILRIALLLGFASALAGCQGLKDAAGGGQESPDAAAGRAGAPGAAPPRRQQPRRLARSSLAVLRTICPTSSELPFTSPAWGGRHERSECRVGVSPRRDSPTRSASRFDLPMLGR